MKGGMWKVTCNVIEGRRMYAVYRLVDPTESRGGGGHVVTCKCGQACIRVRIRRTRRTAWLCTKCGRLIQLDYATGRRVEVWRPRRYGKPVARWAAV